MLKTGELVASKECPEEHVKKFMNIESIYYDLLNQIPAKQERLKQVLSC